MPALNWVVSACALVLVGVSTPHSNAQTTQALSEVTRAANNGDISAEQKLGVIYMTGTGAPIDYKLGIEWLFRAALAGNAHAQRDVAIAYLRGEGVTQSETAAFEWYWQAAEHGDKAAQILLCTWYQEGKGTETDLAIAEAWCLIAPNTSSVGALAAALSANQNLTEEQRLEGTLLANLWKNSKITIIPLHSKWFAEHMSNANGLRKGDHACH